MSYLPSVFFELYEPEDYDLYRGGLLDGRVRLDPHSEETIGARPDWNMTSSRSIYFMFNLHSLRWLYDLIRPGAQGDLAALEAARDIFEYWSAENPVGHTRQSYGWRDEHSVSWRTVTLAWLWQVWSRSSLTDAASETKWRRLAVQHGRFLSRIDNYRAYHNHGANNALALLALGVAFDDTLSKDAVAWRDLSRARVEQQMRDNVSDGGLHLEQSAFYHCYVLRTFLECHRVFEALGRPLSRDFTTKLDRMLDMASRIAGDHAVATCFPYTDPRKDPLRVFPLLGSASVPDDLQGDGAQRFRRAVEGPTERELHLDAHGGYAIFNAPPDELSVVFHTRILDVPHGHLDALGVYATHHGRELLALPSTLEMGGAAWRAYFHGPCAHNTILVDDRPQHPTSRLPDGIATRLFESTKLRNATAALGLGAAVTWLRGQLGLAPLPPRLRSRPRDGRLLGHASDETYEWVAASHRTVERSRHRRDVVRLAGHCLVVRDVVDGADRRIRQTWHFPRAAEVRLDGMRGAVTLNHSGATVDARFVQLADVACRLRRGETGEELAGWYAVDRDEPDPCSALHYEKQAEEAEFIWVLSAGDGPLEATRLSNGRVRVSTGDGVFEVGIDEESVEVTHG